MISIVIPVKNGASTLEKTLRCLRSQTIGIDLEILVLDSSSSDDSKSIASKYDTKIIDIPNGTFNHGLTRNLGLQHASGNLIYFTVQDAWLADNTMLERVANHFIKDDSLMAVVGMQAIAHDADKNPAKWFKRITEPLTEIRHFQPYEFEKLPLAEQYKFSSWDNVNAMYRKEALQQVPFIKTNYAEDWLWANIALAKGFKIMSDPSILVYHYHHMSFSYVFREKYVVAYQFYKCFLVLPLYPSIINDVIKRFYYLFKNEKLSLNKKIYWCGHNISQYFGYFFSVLLFRIINKICNQKVADKFYNKLYSSSLIGGLKNNRRY